MEWSLPALILLPTILLPLARDQGVFAYAGQIILDGGLPYRDFIDQKGPATHYTFAFAIALFGETAIGVRLFFFFVMCAGSQVAAAVAGRLGGIESRLPAALAYALVCSQCPIDAAWMTAQVEDLLLPLFLGVVLLLDSEAAFISNRRLFPAGLVLGLCCLYKPTALIPALGVAGVVGWRLWKSPELAKGQYLRCLAWGSAGFLLLPLLIGFYLVSQPDWLNGFLAVQQFNAGYAQLRDGSLRDAAEIFIDRWLKLVPLVLWGIIGVKERTAPVWVVFWAVLGTSAASLLVQWKFAIIYHWTPLVGCLAILAGVGLGRIRRWVRQSVPHARRGPLLANLAVIIVALTLVPVHAAHPMLMLRRAAEVALGDLSLEEFRAPFPCGTWYGKELEQTVRYVRNHTEPTDRVLVWGYEPAINFLSRRRSPSRFFVERWLTIPGIPRQSDWRAEFIASLRKHPPLYVLVVDDDNRPWYVPNPSDAVHEFPEFAAFLAEHYRLETEFVRIAFYRRKAVDADRTDGLAAEPRNGGT
jgi:hypothetical protein